MTIKKIDAETAEEEEVRQYKKADLEYEKSNLERDIAMLQERIARIDVILNVMK